MQAVKQSVAFLERSVCEGTVGTFRFEKPEGYTFDPGQTFSITLATREGEQTKHFTHSQAPADPYLELTVRLTGSAFKDALLALNPRDSASIHGPIGRRIVPEGIRRVVFLVGGIGVTPARSMLRDAAQRREGLEAVVFYGNQTAACIPFKDELEAYAADRTGWEIVHVLAQPEEGWTGERGFITPEVVRRHVDPEADWYWVVAGPPPMIEPMRRVLADLGVPPERARVESFLGY